jgi:hypothetical protein
MVLRYSQVLNTTLRPWFSPWAILPLRGPQEVSKGPQENDGKLVVCSNFTVSIKYFRCKIAAVHSEGKVVIYCFSHISSS